ncbi:DUF751 family protein [Planktothrix sp. FACHB-1355]|uniref:DUF751 family protein n=1 Tax=Aerosakkonema funiforme FACHB-1375 TaxID=2949571 RepID=A0A926ZL09_9CYAN|nr:MULTISPECIES: DUF751 family protein [Oscillatoriales]MBD2186234.1 DUF751 family protein [Aerosakkonema funiforme FACHB-1375]MBD3563356.1 DUF751 family protein [Planktothrix sp. FACHB-1355]
MLDGFWQNVYRYCTYFVTVITGVFFFLFGWLAPLFRRPVTAIALVSFFIAGLIFVALTLRAMLGLSPV